MFIKFKIVLHKKLPDSRVQTYQIDVHKLRNRLKKGVMPEIEPEKRRRWRA